MAGLIKPEFPEDVVFITSRTNLSRLWFKLCPKLNHFFYAALARYQEIYQVQIFAFCLMGNHYHLLARFPHGNRALFERDFNSILARALPRLVPGFPGGKLWARPYRFQIVPLDIDILHWFLYTVLNPVSSGVSTNPTALGRPNALTIINEGREKMCRWFNRSAYENARRCNPNVDKERYFSNHLLRVSRLPGMEELSDQEYLAKINQLVDERKSQIIKERRSKRMGFFGDRNLKLQKAGTKPLTTKRSTRDSHNPIVLSLCPVTRHQRKRLYLDIVALFKEASYRFRNRLKKVRFPKGTYMPPRFVT
jgi:hypothetical protein